MAERQIEVSFARASVLIIRWTDLALYKSSQFLSIKRCNLRPLSAGAIFGLGGALAMYCHRHKNVHGGQHSNAVLGQLGRNLFITVCIANSVLRVDNWYVTIIHLTTGVLQSLIWTTLFGSERAASHT
jgi:hypothetical protein